MFLLPKGSAVCIIQVHHPFGLVLGKNSNASLATGLLFFFCVFFRVQKGLIDAINPHANDFCPKHSCFFFTELQFEKVGF